MAQIAQKAETDKANQQLAVQKHTDEMMIKQKEFGLQPMLEAMKREFEAKLEVEKLQREDDRAQFSQMIELQKNEADNRQKQMTELMKNRDDNETAIQVKLMELQGQVGQAPEQQAPDFTPIMQEMQAMLSQIEKAKTNDALQATMEGLRAVMTSIHAPTELIRDPTTGKAVGTRKVLS
jgi:hypothetical protein